MTDTQPRSPLTARFDDALVYAHTLHRAQVRKGSGTPYIAHLLAVCAIALEDGASEDEAIGALLHDAAEDQGGARTLAEIERRFGAAVARIVADCTDAWSEPKPEWRARKQAYLSALPNKPAASLRVSLSDKVHNAEAIAEGHSHIGEAVFGRFVGGAEGTRWYYGELARIFERARPGELAERLTRAVAAFATPQTGR
jgi:(p)ppGpp synthase/HD superfamily hydrolase